MSHVLGQSYLRLCKYKSMMTSSSCGMKRFVFCLKQEQSPQRIIHIPSLNRYTVINKNYIQNTFVKIVD